MNMNNTTDPSDKRLQNRRQCIILGGSIGVAVAVARDVVENLEPSHGYLTALAVSAGVAAVAAAGVSTGLAWYFHRCDARTSK